MGSERQFIGSGSSIVGRGGRERAQIAYSRSIWHCTLHHSVAFRSARPRAARPAAFAWSARAFLSGVQVGVGAEAHPTERSSRLMMSNQRIETV